jgi:hypothetical protein
MKMGKLILKGPRRKVRDLNGSLYVLIEAAHAKEMGISVGDEVVSSVYFSQKHQGPHLSVYKPVEEYDTNKQEDKPTTLLKLREPGFPEVDDEPISDNAAD